MAQYVKKDDDRDEEEMEKVESSKVIMRTPKLEDVPELLHHIQTLLPVKDAARTSVLSKSWLYAWSTIPTLRFRESLMSVFIKGEQENHHLNLMDRNLLRYVQDNICVESLDVLIAKRIQESASFTKKWIKLVVSKRCPKELSVTISDRGTKFPGEIFSGNNLDTVRVIHSDLRLRRRSTNLRLRANPVINCTSLRVLELENVSLREEVIHKLLSTCKVLEKISLCALSGGKTIKIKNLHCLRDLKYNSVVGHANVVLEIDDVPSLRAFHYSVKNWPKSLNADSLGGLTHLSLDDIQVDDALLDMIQFKFPCLESLSIKVRNMWLERLPLKCASLKRFSLSFCYICSEMPTLSFSTISTRKINLILTLSTLDNSFFIKMRETFNSSHNFDIQIILSRKKVSIDVKDLRGRVPFPATNVQLLTFKGAPDQHWWQKMHVVDAFNVICHPNCIRYSSN